MASHEWMDSLPSLRAWIGKAQLPAVEVRFTEAEDGTWQGVTVTGAGEDVIGGPAAVVGQPTREACERAMVKLLVDRLRLRARDGSVPVPGAEEVAGGG